VRHLADAVRHAPDNAAPLLDLAWAFRALGQADKAHASIGRALALATGDAAPFAPPTLLARADLLLAEGRYAEGWPAWLAARQAVGHAMPVGGPDEWSGSVRLIAAADDAATLMWLRLVPVLAARGLSIELACHDLLAPLAARMPGIAAVVRPGAPMAGAPAVAIAIEDLPAILGSTPENSGATPYLTADPARVARWVDALAPWPGPRIGLAWAERAPGAVLSDLLPAMAGLGATLVSLEAGRAAVQLGTTHGIVEAGPHFETYDDVAAAIAALDLVVAVDSSIAHLAGALGKPVILLLDMTTHWRWGLKDETASWYPRTTLLRRAGDGWAGVTDRLADAAARWLGAGSAGSAA
jgi:hypothetical protein